MGFGLWLVAGPSPLLPPPPPRYLVVVTGGGRWWRRGTDDTNCPQGAAGTTTAHNINPRGKDDWLVGGVALVLLWAGHSPPEGMREDLLCLARRHRCQPPPPKEVGDDDVRGKGIWSMHDEACPGTVPTPGDMIFFRATAEALRGDAAAACHQFARPATPGSPKGLAGWLATAPPRSGGGVQPADPLQTNVDGRTPPEGMEWEEGEWVIGIGAETRFIHPSSSADVSMFESRFHKWLNN
ncbi:hypothetical protein GPALN_011486 [Globodera pallida]|nr:hypothetical protein GPALN_011486 [Globodera pallida]